ncbi:MAG TPA: hypothetical protein VEQ58_03755, partial [Polyangiaceae bacterium]|nr:hypothetical protein [Polyangiaceae bacterium]
EANRRGVSIVRRQGSPDVFRSLSEIESAAFSGTERVVALLTKAGQLSVINARGQVLYQADVET